MSPRANKPQIQYYRPVLSEQARDALTGLAESLQFVVTRPSLYLGQPSVSDMLEALAAAYERDPAAVRLMFKTLGIHANPTADDVRFTSEPPAE